MAGSNTDALKLFFQRTIDGLIEDASGKSQKIPVSSFRSEADEISGTFYAADYFKYLIYGRGSGKAPPPEKMLQWVQANPDALARAKQVFRYITEQGLAYIVGQKIAKMGTDIHLGKRPGIDLLGVMDKNMPDLLKELTRNEVIKIATDLKAAVK
jgi:hypothetical protein